MRALTSGLLTAILLGTVGCASSAPSSTPTVTVTAAPSPAPTVTATPATDRDGPLDEMQAWTICAAATLGALREAMYSSVLPADGGEVVDHGDGSFVVTVHMDTEGGLQPAFGECHVSGSMGDPNVSVEVTYYDSQ